MIFIMNFFVSLVSIVNPLNHYRIFGRLAVNFNEQTEITGGGDNTEQLK